MSINITDMDVTPMHVAFEEVKKDAEDLSVAVTGSELVCGLNFTKEDSHLIKSEGWSRPTELNP